MDLLGTGHHHAVDVEVFEEEPGPSGLGHELPLHGPPGADGPRLHTSGGSGKLETAGPLQGFGRK